MDGQVVPTTSSGATERRNDNGTAVAPFSWASVTKSAAAVVSKGDDSNNVDVLAEQQLCRVLEEFIKVFGFSYEDARELLELMQVGRSFILYLLWRNCLAPFGYSV